MARRSRGRTRRRTRGRTVLASTLLLGTVAAVAAGCATLGLEHPPTAAPAIPTVARTSAKPTGPATAPGLTETQAHAALITDTDLGAPWIPTRGAATWRDGMLKATTSTPPARSSWTPSTPTNCSADPPARSSDSTTPTPGPSSATSSPATARQPWTARWPG